MAILSPILGELGRVTVCVLLVVSMKYPSPATAVLEPPEAVITDCQEISFNDAEAPSETDVPLTVILELASLALDTEPSSKSAVATEQSTIALLKFVSYNNDSFTTSATRTISQTSTTYNSSSTTTSASINCSRKTNFISRANSVYSVTTTSRTSCTSCSS